MLLQRIFIGILMIGLGIAFVKLARKIYGWFGGWGLIEQKFGSGSTQTAWRLMGLLLIFFGFLYAIGQLDPVLLAILRFFRSLLGGV